MSLRPSSIKSILTWRMSSSHTLRTLQKRMARMPRSMRKRKIRDASLMLEIRPCVMSFGSIQGGFQMSHS